MAQHCRKGHVEDVHAKACNASVAKEYGLQEKRYQKSRKDSPAQEEAEKAVQDEVDVAGP